MALETQTTYDYTFGSDAYLHYCSEHEVLRVADRSGDSVLLSNITEKQIDVFIKFYNEYVKCAEEKEEAGFEYAED